MTKPKDKVVEKVRVTVRIEKDLLTRVKYIMADNNISFQSFVKDVFKDTVEAYERIKRKESKANV